MPVEIADLCLYRESKVMLVLDVHDVEEVSGEYPQRYVCLNHQEMEQQEKDKV